MEGVVPVTVRLSKGGKVDLTKEAGGHLAGVTVGLGWTTRTTSGADFDLDASAFVLTENGRVLNDDWFVFFNNLKSPDGSVTHMGDDLTGGDGNNDDEQIKIDLLALPERATKIDVSVTIYDADGRNQTFGQIRQAFVRIVDDSTGNELARYDLSENASSETAMVFGQLYREGDSWNFRAVGQGYSSGLYGLCAERGVNV